MTDKKLDIFVTVVSPIVGSPEAVKQFVHDTAALLREKYTNYELVLVDGGAEAESIDLLVDLIKHIACIRVIRLSATTNREIMIFAGLEAAIGDYVVVLTPDNDPPTAIVDVVDLMQSGFDIVYGLSDTPVPRSLLGQLGSRIFYWYGRKFIGLDIPLNATYLVGQNRRSINALTRIKGRYRHIRHLTRQVGFKTSAYHYTPVAHSPRHERGLLESFRLANEIIVSYSHHPLQLVSRLGLVASGANLLYAVYAISVYFLDKRVMEGWTTLSLELAVMFFLLFIILSVICEYIGRILEETRAQPAYHIMEELSSNVLVADETRLNVTA